MAKKRVHSKIYRRADLDSEFLESDATRGVRLQMEYLKAELLLREQGIGHTILVMGGTRMKAASHYYKVAREFGRIVGRAGGRRKGARGALMTGGGPGIMEAANRGAYEVGAPSIGLNVSLPREQAPNRYLTPGLSLRFRYFALRKLHFLLRARAMVAFPGGFGTFDELFEALTLVQTRKIKPMPIVLVGESYWRRAFNVDFLVSQGAITARDRRLFCYAETALQAWNVIARWYRAAGEPVFPAR